MRTASRLRRLPALLAAAVLCLFATRASAGLGTARTAHTSTLLPTGDVLIAGGIDNSGTYLATTQLAKMSKDNSIVPGPSLTVLRASHTATVMGNGCVLIAGGRNGGAVLNDARIYDPISNTIVATVGGMTARYNHTATLLNDGRVLLCGGQTNLAGTTVDGTCDLFKPSGVMGAGTCSGVFSPAAVSLLHARTLHTATLLQDGKVWFAGGWDGSGFVSTTEKYIPAPPAGAGSFSSASPMIQSRSNHTATMMGDGRILVAGGFDALNIQENKGILDTLEIYDPVADNTIPGPSLDARLHMHSSTLLANGDVMLFGGLGNITTTYLQPALTFTDQSIIDAPGGVVTPAAPIPNVPLLATLSEAVAGTINNGVLLLSSPTVTTPWGHVYFTDPLVVSLAGTQAGCVTSGTGQLCGNINEPAINLPNASGSASFTPINPASVTGKATGGTLSASGSSLIAGSDTVFSTKLAMNSLQGATVSGNITGITGTITSPSYSIDVTNGSLAVTNAPVDLLDSMAISPADATSLLGTITYAPLTALDSGSQVTTSGKLYFSPATLDATNKTGTLTNQLIFPFQQSNASFPIILNLPSDLANSVIDLTLTITAGSINQTSGSLPAADYGATLTGGTIFISGASVNFAGQLATTVNAGLLTGTIAVSSGVVNSGVDVTGAVISVSGNATYTATTLDPTGANVTLSGTFNYSATHINLGKDVLSVHTSTIAISQMVFGQAQYYIPTSNSVSFFPSPGGGTVDAGSAIETFGHTATLLPTNDVFVAGGSDCTSAACTTLAADGMALIEFDEVKNFDASVGSLKTSRALHTSTLLTDGTILVAGGTTGLDLLKSAELFDPLTGQYKYTAGSLSEPRDFHTATLLTNGRVLIAGGSSTNSVSTGPISSTDIYYPDTQLFIPTTPLAAVRSHHTATLMPDGKVIVVGGVGAGNVVTGTAESFDPEHLSWTSLATTSPRSLHSATLLKDGRLMIAGGTDGASLLSSVFAYNPGTGLWAPLASMPVALFSHSATLLFDGRVLVAGGNDGNGETNSSYIYDPVADNWTPNTPPTTRPITQPRFGQTSTLLPDGAVMISGGSVKSGPLPIPIETYKVGGSSWTAGNQFKTARAFHTMTLAPNGRVYAIGGTNGVIGGSGTAFLPQGEEGYFSSEPDIFGKNQPPSLRQSSFTIASVTPLQAGETLTLAGTKLLGGTEGSGGGSASADSSQDIPHLVLQKIDASDFALDLTTYVFITASPTNTSLNAVLPSAAASMPFGWYNARVGVNGVYSNGTFVQVGPAKPASAPTGLVGTAQGISSITWTWGSVVGADGYNVYYASTNVFIATAAATSFIQTGISPNTAMQIRVAGYTLSGDGPSAVSPLTAVVPITVINLLQCNASAPGSGDSTTSVPWTWTNVPSAATYNVYNSTTGALIAVTATNSYYDVGLATNTARVLKVSAVSAGIEGLLSSPTTCYTLAAPPLAPLIAQNLPLMDVTTTTVLLNWIVNTNPPGTNFNAVLTSFNSTNTITTTIVSTSVAATFSALSPSNYYTAQIFAVNGAGALAGPLTAGTTYTLPAPAQSVSVQATNPVSISVQWDTNFNSTMTIYQVRVSTRFDFTGTISTAVPFSSRFTGSSTTVSGLITGQLYFIGVTAANPFGQMSVESSTKATTDNGGAPIGSLAGLIPAIGGSDFSGTIGGLPPLISRYVDMRSPGGTFPADTVVTISTYSLLDPGHVACTNAVSGIGGAGIALSIENNPALQPIRPLYLTGGYTSAEAATFPAPTSQLAFARYDPLSGTCVPLQTLFNTTARTFQTELNHFSLYELVSVPLATTADTARVFPNPFHAATDGFVTIDQIPPAARVRIFTLRGERILDAVANGAGNVTWNADNSAGRPVASGLYLIVIESGGTKKIMKLAVIR
jgi:hypothetical protein